MSLKTEPNVSVYWANFFFFKPGENSKSIPKFNIHLSSHPPPPAKKALFCNDSWPFTCQWLRALTKTTIWPRADFCQDSNCRRLSFVHCVALWQLYKLFLKGVTVKLPLCFFFLQNVIAWTNLGVLYLKHGKIEVNNVIDLSSHYMLSCPNDGDVLDSNDVALKWSAMCVWLAVTWFWCSHDRLLTAVYRNNTALCNNSHQVSYSNPCGCFYVKLIHFGQTSIA